MPEPTNRRGFLRTFVRGAGEALVDIAGGGTADEPEPRPAVPTSSDPAPVLTPALPVTRSLTVDELLDLAAQEGLADRQEALRELARPSTRLSPALGAGPATSSIGRRAATARADGTVASVAEIDLADPALAASALPANGRLVVRIVVPRRAPIARCGRATVRVEPAVEVAGVEALPVELSTELTLPRVWAAPVLAVGLDEGEQNRYVRLRERVAELQGVTAGDDGEEGVARHHLLGYPTETSGTMPLACELAARGLDLDTPPGDVPDGVVAASARWRLLLQLTQDERGGVTVGAGVARLFLWIAQDRLARHDFSEVWAIAR